MAEKPDMAAITATPEFKRAVAEAAALAVAEIAKSATLPTGTSPDNSFLAFAQLLAGQIGEVADQGTSRKRVAPEILAKRAAASKRCDDLIALARASGGKPEYRLKTKIYFNERIIEPYRRNTDKTVVQQEIIWEGRPNEAMLPINSIAEEIYDAYRESIGAAPRIQSLTGSHGGVVAPDNRPMWVTPGGLVVKGDPPPKAFTTAQTDSGFRDNNDPNAPVVHVLGTVAAPARRNAADLGTVTQRAM